MKLVREYLYERFSDESDPIADMSIGARAQIQKWFESIGLSPADYTIDHHLKITVRGDLYLQGTAITQLPDNLTVGGDLDLRDTAITRLPETLKVKGNIYKDF